MAAGRGPARALRRADRATARIGRRAGDHRPREPMARHGATPSKPTARPKASRSRPRKRQVLGPRSDLGQAPRAYRPGLVTFVLDELAELYGRPAWQRRLDPTSELILTILTQNSADINAEVAFEALRARYPGAGVVEATRPGRRLGRRGPAGRAWRPTGRGRVRATPRAGRHHPAGRARQPEGATDPGDAAPDPRGARRLLAGVPRRDDRARRPRLAGRRSTAIGKKTASVLLLFSLRPAADAGRPPRRAGRAAGRAAAAEGGADDAHDLFLGMLEPDQMYEAHVNLIQHGRKVCQAPSGRSTTLCPLRPRCRFVDPKAP